jgi:hypothetical protein
MTAHYYLVIGRPVTNGPERFPTGSVTTRDAMTPLDHDGPLLEFDRDTALSPRSLAPPWAVVAMPVSRTLLHHQPTG